MPKILSQTGISLSDTYDVEGSIVGVEQLIAEDVSLVHEMGSTIFSERYSGSIRKAVTGDISQSAAMIATVAGLASNTRVLGIAVISDTVARTAHANVAVGSVTTLRELPIWVWDGTNEDTVRFFDVTLGNKTMLRPLPAFSLLPNMLQGTAQPEAITNIVLHGAATAFGAGTVELTLLVHVGFSEIGGISSKGLPLPSW